MPRYPPLNLSTGGTENRGRDPRSLSQFRSNLVPRYCFHSEDGAFYKDEDGEELPNEAAAKEEAV